MFWSYELQGSPKQGEDKHRERGSAAHESTILSAPAIRHPAEARQQCDMGGAGLTREDFLEELRGSLVFGSAQPEHGLLLHRGVGVCAGQLDEEGYTFVIWNL